MKTITDDAVTNTMMLIGDRIISLLQSGVDGNRISLMGTAVSIAVKTAIMNQISHGAASNMVKDAALKMETQPKVVSMIVGGLKKSNKLMSAMLMFVATTVRQEPRKVDLVKKGY